MSDWADKQADDIYQAAQYLRPAIAAALRDAARKGAVWALRIAEQNAIAGDINARLVATIIDDIESGRVEVEL